jgi:hypothetical protein
VTLTLAKQRDMLKARLAGVASTQPTTSSRDELIRAVLPGAVLPPPGMSRTPPGGVSAADVLAAKQVAAAGAGAPRPAAPAAPPQRSTPAPRRQQADPKMRALFKAAVKDVDGK